VFAFNKNFEPKESPPKDQGAESQFERYKRKFQQRLEAIKNKELSTENIDSFADSVLNELIDLAGSVTDAYARSEDIEKENTKEFEQDAFEHFGLTDLSKVLELAHKKIESLERVNNKIANTPKIDTVITPPDTEDPALEFGEEDYEKPETEPRLKTLLYILENNGIDVEGGVDTLKGKITDEMMRNTSYVTVSIPEIDRVVQVCDEVGNASYVFKLSAVDVENINDMTKSEKNDLLEANPEIGLRIEYYDGWRQTLQQLLFTDEIEMTKAITKNNDKSNLENEKQIPRVRSGELDKWRGFYVDEDGEHWATIGTISDYFNARNETVKKKMENVRTQKIKGLNNNTYTGYCLEDLLGQSWFRKRRELEQTKTEGKWEGFYVDESGRHFGSANSVADKLDESHHVVSGLSDEVSKMQVIGPNGQEFTAYCLEEVEKELGERMSLPKVEESGEWKGFLIGEDSNHYGSIMRVADKLEMSHNILEKHKGKLSQIEALGLKGRSHTAYCLEDAAEMFDERISLPDVEKSGEWEGFYIDENEKHFGSKTRIGQKLGIGRRKISKEEETISTMKVMGLNGREITAYCLEDVKKRFGEQISLPKVDGEGEWQNFYITESGNHYGSPKKIAQKLEVSESLIRTEVDELSGIEVKGRNNQKFTAYCLEDIQEELEGRLSLPEVESEGEWEGFYPDEEGDHYGSISKIAEKLKLSDALLRKHLDNISERQVLGITGRERTAYCLEDAKDALEEFNSLPKVKGQGNWEGFYIDEDGKHYGLLTKVANKLDVTTKTIKRYSDRIDTRKVIGGRNRKQTAYCYEDLEELI
jgi:biotin operon repressor